MFVRIFFIFLGFFIPAFIFWKKLKDDYLEENLFSSIFYIFTGISAGFLLSRLVLPEFWFWLTLIGSVSGLAVSLHRFKFNLYEILDGYTFSQLSIILLIFFYDFLENMKLSSGGGFFLIVLFFGLFLFLDKRYKSYTWYKSGKVGFTGLVVIGLFFLTRAGVAVTFPDMLSLVGRNDAIISGVVAFAAYLMLFNLSKE